MPGKVDDDNSSYQVFLRFNFEFGEAKSKEDPKPKSVKAGKPILEVKEIEEDKEVIYLNDDLAIESIDDLELDALDLKFEILDN